MSFAVSSREDARPAGPVTGARPRWTRATSGALVAILIGVAAFQIATIRPGHNWGDDFAMYIAHAKNLAEGHEYSETGYIYNRDYPQVGPRSYPPVFPLLLTPVVRVFGLHLKPMKVEIVLFLVGALALLAWLIRNDWPPIWTISLVAAVGFNPFLWDFKDQVLSDVPFLFFVMGTLVLMRRAYAPGTPPSTRTGLVLGLAMFLAAGTRTVGVVLLPALLAVDLLRFRRPSRTLVAAFALFAGLTTVQSLLVHVDTSYRDQLTITWDVMRGNVHRYPQDLALIWGTKDSHRLGWALYWASGALAAVGWLSRIAQRRERAPVLEVFAALYLLPVVLWPTYQGTRFLIAWIPIYLFFALAGVRVIGRMLGRNAAQATLALSVVAVAVTYGETYAHFDYGPIRTGVERPATRELFAYVRTHTSANDVFLVKRPRAFALFTGRSASVYHQPAPMQLLAYIDQIHASYVIVGPEDGPYLRSFVSDSEDRLREVFRNTEFKMYQVTTGPA